MSDRVPGSERAYYAPGKTRYLLWDPTRTKFFRNVLGFEDEHALSEQLDRLTERLPDTPARFSRLNDLGRENWLTLMEIEGPRRAATIVVIWQVDDEGRAALVTARPLQRRDRLRFE